MTNKITDRLLRALPRAEFIRYGYGMSFADGLNIHSGDKSLLVVEDGIKAQEPLSIIVGENAELVIIRLQFCAQQETINTLSNIQIANSGKLHLLTISYCLGNIQNDVCAKLDEGSNCKLDAIIIGSGTGRCIYKAKMEHLSVNSNSDQIVKMILGQESQADFEGLIKVDSGAQHTEAYQRSNALVLSPKAKSRTLPHLEIYADDVKCSHGATVGQIDTDALFYMQNRGVGLETAKKMLIGAFAKEPLERLQNDAISDVIERLMADLLQNI